MLIGALSTETGVPASTIRYYEKLGILPRPPRVSGQRRYGTESKEYLLVLKLAQACGFHLDEMRVLLQGFSKNTKPPERWRKLAEQKKHELDEQIEKLRLMRRLVEQVADCQCVDLAECARTACAPTPRQFVAIKT
jgi:DNA-binding transcriptional MerR regulator